MQEVWIGTWRALTQQTGGPIETEGAMSVIAVLRRLLIGFGRRPKSTTDCEKFLGTLAVKQLINLVSIIFALSIATAQFAASQQRGASPFWPEIQAFMAEDEARGVAPCRTLFVGSSSIRFWHDLAADMPRRKIVRRGFGGAHIAHVRRYFEVLIARHRPREIVLYAGENDISGGAAPAQVLADLKALIEFKRRTLGPTPVYYIAIKPSIRRWHEFAVQARTNAMIKDLAATQRDLVFIDVVQVMLEGGRPKKIFASDGLHMNRSGYDLWAGAIKSALDNAVASTSSHCRKKLP